MELKQKDIHFEKFPEVEKYESKIKTKEICELNSSIWKAKKEAGLSLKSPVREVVLPETFKPIEKDLVEMHRMEKIAYGDKLEITL
jgi:valyl-tRNA synthetase